MADRVVIDVGVIAGAPAVVKRVVLSVVLGIGSSFMHGHRARYSQGSDFM
ncbi:MAG: hypothetical protein IPJ42_17960 [Betaproteobacteria bacterium]|nr:hypothetical protein [Betaproteobacteria bacterium]